MAGSYSHNALSAKARAKFGKRLTLQNYNELLACQSIGEAALYLKNRTYFGPFLSEVRSVDVHRGRLEELLRRKSFEDYSSLCVFEYAGREFFYEIIVLRGEIQQILHCIRLLNYGQEDEYLFHLPTFFEHHTDIRLMDLAKCKTFDDILAVLKGTPFEPLLSPYAGKRPDELDLTTIETRLYHYLYDRAFALIERHTRGKMKKELLDFYYMTVELDNVLRILRYKNAFSTASPDEIRSRLLPYEHVIKKEELDAMLHAKTANEAFAVFKRTKYGHRLSQTQGGYLEETLSALVFREALHTMRFSVNPPAVFFAYTIIAENELRNIINIIEGIRYQLPPDKIRELLILEHA